MSRRTLLFAMMIASTILAGFRRSGPNEDFVNELRSSFFPLSSEVSFDSIASLENYFKLKKVVMLSDGHHEGSSKAPNLRLIQFLHEKCGYDVVIFESDLYDAEFMQQCIGTEPDSLYYFARHHIRNFISHCSDAEPIFRYASSTYQTNTPLTVTGFDCDFVRDEHAMTSLTHEIDSVIRKNDATFSAKRECQTFLTLFDSLLHNNAYFRKDTANIEFAKQYADSVGNRLQYVNDPSGWWPLIGRNIKRNIACYTLTGKHPDIVALNRETGLWDNLNWLLSTKYKGKKVIVWASGFHLSDNANILVDTKNNFPVNTCAHYLRNSMWKDSITFFPSFPVGDNPASQGKMDESVRALNSGDGIIVFDLFSDAGKKQLHKMKFSSASMEYYYDKQEEGFVLVSGNTGCKWVE